MQAKDQSLASNPSKCCNSADTRNTCHDHGDQHGTARTFTKLVSLARVATTQQEPANLAIRKFETILEIQPDSQKLKPRANQHQRCASLHHIKANTVLTF